jgi:hypothetical protein
MKTVVEFRSFMSRAELDQALRITIEAAGRLAHRMTPADLQRLENYSAALAAIAENERRQARLPRSLIKAPVTIEGRAS